jgi:RNA polymerase sigma-70 factor (ECF subfamily)
MLDIDAIDASRPRAPIREASDADLIESIADGDRQAMQTFFLRHRTGVFQFAMRIARNPSVADEVANDVFLDVWRKASRFESRSRVLTWLLAITRNKALSALRQRPTEAIDQDIAEKVVDTDDDPEAAICKLENNSVVRECLIQLSPAHRAIIDLIYFQERSIGEVAQMVEVPVNTVKSQMFYARKRLEGLLIEKGINQVWH